MAYCTVQNVADFMSQLGFDAETFPAGPVVEMNIELAASEIDICLQSSGQDTCTKSAAGNTYLKLLNIIGAMLLTEFDNARTLSLEDLARYQTWKDKQTDLLRQGLMVVCAGQSGINYPYVETAEVGYTPDAQGNIVINNFRRHYSG